MILGWVHTFLTEGAGWACGGERQSEVGGAGGGITVGDGSAARMCADTFCTQVHIRAAPPCTRVHRRRGRRRPVVVGGGGRPQLPARVPGTRIRPPAPFFPWSVQRGTRASMIKSYPDSFDRQASHHHPPLPLALPPSLWQSSFTQQHPHTPLPRARAESHATDHEASLE